MHSPNFPKSWQQVDFARTGRKAIQVQAAQVNPTNANSPSLTFRSQGKCQGQS